jgi:hypothetical protein
VVLTALPSITTWHPVPPLLTMSWKFLLLLHAEWYVYAMLPWCNPIV